MVRRLSPQTTNEVMPVGGGGTGATTAPQALTNVGAYPAIGGIPITGQFTISWNIAGVLPTQAATSGSITQGWNYSSGSGELSVINNYWGATAFQVGTQRTGASTQVQVYKFNPDGSLYLGVSQAQVATQAFVNTTIAARTQNNVGRNLLHNCRFRLNSRGTVSVTATVGYIADRWVHFDNAAGTRTLTRVATTAADKAALGDDDIPTYIQVATTGSAAAGDYEYMMQRIENVSKASGKPITYSFWARATTAGAPLAVEFQQFPGGTGSLIPAQGVTKYALTTTWTRYTGTLTPVAVSGMTGYNQDGTDYTQFMFWFSSGSNYNARNGTIGAQTSTVQITAVQIELGSTATPLEKLDMAEELKDCERFYQTQAGIAGGYTSASGQIVYNPLTFPTRMRVVPTVIVTPSGGAGYSAVIATAANTGGVVLQATSNAIGQLAYNFVFTATADL